MPVLNKYKDDIPADAIYIGRGSMWGNPYVMGKDGNRDEVIAKYQKYLWTKIQNDEFSLEQLAALRGRSLVCFCSPLRCHGEILVKAAEWAYTRLNPIVD